MAPEFTEEQVLVFKAARALADRVFALLAEEGGSADPRSARSRTDYISYEDAKVQWEALVARYGVGLGAPSAKR